MQRVQRIAFGGGQQIPVGAALVVCLMLMLAVLMAYYLYVTARAERRLGR